MAAFILGCFIVFCITIFMTYTWYVIYTQMKRKHSYEFHRVKWTLFYQLTLQLLFLAHFAISYYLYWPFEGWGEDYYQQGYCDELNNARLILITLTKGLYIDSLIFAFIIVRVKSSQDILQSVSKLDHLLKVSVFQKYKNQQMEDRKYTMVMRASISDSFVDEVVQNLSTANMSTKGETFNHE